MKPPTRARAPKTVEQESLDRLRRIETRITTLSIALGVDEHTQKPTFTPAPPGGVSRVHLPSRDSTIKAITKCLPAGWTDPIDLVIGDETIGRLVLTARS